MTQSEPMRALFAEHAYLPQGWQRNVSLEWDEQGVLGAMAALTEYRTHAGDDFWSWRTLMYRFAARITPQGLAAIARWLYIAMLKAGYTSVCEFHYVHHAPDGSGYGNSAELAERAALEALKLSAGPAYHSKIVHFENNIPIQYEDRYVNPLLFPHYLEQDFTHQTPNRYMMQVAPLQHAEYRIFNTSYIDN